MISVPMISDFLKQIKKQVYDDAVDRLNYYYTPLILIFFALVTSAKTFVGSPIQCWVPAEFKGGWEQYTEDYCFIKNTYYVPMHEDIPNSHEHREEREIGYYQWVPILLAIQALLFCIPNFLWKGFCFQSGIDLKSILTKSMEISKVSDADNREKEIGELGKYVSETLGEQRDFGVRTCRRFLCVRCGKRTGSYVSSLYLLVKVFYMVNIVGQFFMLNSFLGTSYQFWGVQIMEDLLMGREWKESGHFPRVTMCDLKIRKLGNIHNYSIQCVLMMNMFNEKIFIFVWFWLFIVAISTVLNFLYWLFSTIPSSHREDLIAKYMRISSQYGDGDGYEASKIRRFVQNRLRPDGVLVLRFISGHAGDFVAMRLAKRLFDDYTAPSFTRDLRAQMKMTADMVDNGSDSTKSTSPDRDNEFHEHLYEPGMKKTPLDGDLSTTPLMPSAPMAGNGYPGPPAHLPPKPKLAQV